MSVGSILKVVVVDAEKAGLAIVHEVEALPSQIDHAVIDLFKITAKLFGSAAVKEAVSAAETYLQSKAVSVVGTLVNDVEKTDAIAWVKGTLMKVASADPALGIPTDVLGASSLASLALHWVMNGISLVEDKITGAETAAGVSQ